MTRIQIIERNGKPAFYLVPAAAWERVRDAIEDAEDAIEYEQAIESDDGLRFPLPVAMALAEGVHAVRAFREYRQMPARGRHQRRPAHVPAQPLELRALPGFGGASVLSAFHPGC